MSKCRGCQANIIWVITATGAKQPVDAKPTKQIVLREREGMDPLGVVVDTYMPHHATCPAVEMFRKPAAEDSHNEPTG